MDESEIINFEDRTYSNPQIGLDETNAFIDNLRNIQAQDTARINQDTYALGTQVPSNKGGLSGSEASFAERYQVPQTEKMIADLKATAQTNALNQALENTLAQYKNRYQQAYRAAKKRANASSSGGGSSSNTSDGDVETPGYNLEADQYVPGVVGGYTVANITGVDENGNITTDGYTYVPYGEEYKTNYTYTNKDLANTTSATNTSSTNRPSVQEVLAAGMNKLGAVKVF